MPSATACTLVTCYYRFPSKHTFEEYRAWMKNFLEHIQTPLVIFCGEECFEELQAMRRVAGEAAVANTMIIVKPLASLMCMKYINYWKKDVKRDHERHIHNEMLYIVWNEKSHFVQQAIAMDVFETPYFCWCDIGCFRDSATMATGRFDHFPDPVKIAEFERNKMHMLNIQPFDEFEVMYFKNFGNDGDGCSMKNLFEYSCRIGGTIFLGHRDVWAQWIPKYYETLELFMKHDQFAGKDQSVMAAMCLLYPGLVNLIRPVQGDGDPWFYIQRTFTQVLV